MGEKGKKCSFMEGMREFIESKKRNIRSSRLEFASGLFHFYFHCHSLSFSFADKVRSDDDDDTSPCCKSVATMSHVPTVSSVATTMIRPRSTISKIAEGPAPSSQNTTQNLVIILEKELL